MANGEKQSRRLNFYIDHKLGAASEEAISLIVQSLYSPYNTVVAGQL